jgi:hypothetical protein
MRLPAAYAATLADVQDVFPGSMIAGGALRDIDNERPVKDLDVFAPCVASFDDLRLRVAGTPQLGLHKILRIMGSYDDWGTSEVVGVLDVDGPWGPYQLIGLSTGPETILRRLDFGICQIGHDGRRLVRTEAYFRDKADQTFTMVRCDDRNQLDRSLRRFKRLTAEKYRGWKFVDPQAFRRF